MSHAYLMAAVSLLVLIFFSSGCISNTEEPIVNDYKVGANTILTSINSLEYKLPEYVNFYIEVETDENTEPTLAIDKAYQKSLTLEHFNKYNTVGESKDRIKNIYEFCFSSIKPDTFHFPGFNISLKSAEETLKIKTDSIQLIITGVTNNSSAALKPIASEIRFYSYNMVWWFTLLCGIVCIWYYKKLFLQQTQVTIKPEITLHHYINKLEEIKQETLSPQEFDNKINQTLESVKTYISYTEYDQLTSEWELYYTKQSFSSIMEEKLRRDSLISFIKNHSVIQKRLIK